MDYIYPLKKWFTPPNMPWSLLMKKCENKGTKINSSLDYIVNEM